MKSVAFDTKSVAFDTKSKTKLQKIDKKSIAFDKKSIAFDTKYKQKLQKFDKKSKGNRHEIISVRQEITFDTKSNRNFRKKTKQ